MKIGRTIEIAPNHRATAMLVGISSPSMSMTWMWSLTIYVQSDVRIQVEPVAMQEGPNSGLTWVYFLTPWGMQLELVIFPKGMPINNATTRHLWRPYTMG